MYLTEKQICKYAEAILDGLGKWVRERDVIYGGTESVSNVYNGYGLTVSREYNCDIEIRFDNRTVYTNDSFVGGRWELVLQEVYRAIPKILAARRADDLREKREKDFKDDCRKYVLSWRSWETLSGTAKMGEYRDDVVEIEDWHGRLRIFEKRRKRLFLSDKVLVYTSDKYEQDEVVPNNGSWRKHVEQLILIGKQEARRHSELVRKQKAEESATRLEDYLEQLRNL